MPPSVAEDQGVYDAGDPNAIESQRGLASVKLSELKGLGYVVVCGIEHGNRLYSVVHGVLPRY